MLCRQKNKDTMHNEQEVQNTIRNARSLFPILQRDEELHKLVDRMGYLRAWDLCSYARKSAE